MIIRFWTNTYREIALTHFIVSVPFMLTCTGTYSIADVVVRDMLGVEHILAGLLMLSVRKERLVFVGLCLSVCLCLFHMYSTYVLDSYVGLAVWFSLAVNATLKLLKLNNQYVV